MKLSSTPVPSRLVGAPDRGSAARRRTEVVPVDVVASARGPRGGPLQLAVEQCAGPGSLVAGVGAEAAVEVVVAVVAEQGVVALVAEDPVCQARPGEEVVVRTTADQALAGAQVVARDRVLTRAAVEHVVALVLDVARAV